MLVRAILAALLLPLPAAADRPIDHNAHGWYTFFGGHPIGGSGFGIHIEGQYRRHGVLRTWQQLLLRPAVNFQLTKGLMLTAGYAFVRSHTYSSYAAPAPAANEHRIWQQAWFRYGRENLRWSTRVRFENRFIAATHPERRSVYRFENRIRAWQQATVPISERLYLTAYDEIWFYVKPYVSNSAFDQNRAYVGMGIRLKPSLRFEAAYMNQSLLQRSGAAVELNHTLVLSLFSNAPIFKR